MFVDERNAVVVKQGAVGGYRETDILAERRFFFPSVSDKLFYDVEIQKRLSAEKVKLGF